MATTTRIQVFDTTLRDGEQAPGFSMTASEKLRLAQQLDRLGVDIIEAGFPISSDGDFEAVRTIAAAVRRPIIAGLARAIPADIDRAWAALSQAARPRIHVFLATSDIHLEHKLRITREQCLDQIKTAVARARGYCADVEFSAEDATRSDLNFLCDAAEAAVNAGATTINLPDTVGYALPSDIERMFTAVGQRIRAALKNGVVMSAHCHNDLGMAVANSLAAIQAGARQVECTINGIGERAGNASLEELVMALHVRRSYFNPFLGRPAESSEPLTAVRTEEITKTSRLVSHLTGMAVQPNKAIVGANAFAHESGIHQDGVLKNRLTYEIIDARTVGLADNRISLGKLSGRSAFRARLEELGYRLEGEDLNDAFLRFKELADRKREISDRDLEAIISEQVQQSDQASFLLRRVQVSCGTGLLPTATVTLEATGGEEHSAACIGTGPVDAVCQALNQLAGVPNE
ncbi:MAG: 2-isopropylmalate synthase, partial [Acidobacteriota bacterium]